MFRSNRRVNIASINLNKAVKKEKYGGRKNSPKINHCCQDIVQTTPVPIDNPQIKLASSYPCHNINDDTSTLRLTVLTVSLNNRTTTSQILSIYIQSQWALSPQKLRANYPKMRQPPPSPLRRDLAPPPLHQELPLLLA